MIFILQMFYFQIICEFLNSQASIQFTKIAISKYVFSLLPRTLNLPGNEFVNISDN